MCSPPCTTGHPPVGSPELVVDLHDPVNAAVPPDWDLFVEKATLLPTWRWAVVRANAFGRSGRFLAAVIRDGESVVALANLRLRGPRRVGLGVVDVEAPGSSALPGLALDVGAEPLGRTPVDAALVRQTVIALERTLRAEFGRSLALIWYRQVYAHLLPILTQGVAITYAGAPVAYFRNSYPDYDQYLSSLSKSRRVDQRRLMRRSDEDPSITITWGAVTPEFDVQRFYDLVLATDRRNQQQRWPPRRYPSRQVIDALLGSPATRMLSYHRDGELICGSLVIDHPATPLSSAYGALDPHAGGRSGIWFDQMGRVMRWLVESKRAGLIGGKGLSGLKREVGHQSIPQWSVLRRLR